MSMEKFIGTPNWIQKIRFIRYKIENPLVWSTLFLLEHILSGRRNQKFLITSIKKQIEEFVKYHYPSSHNAKDVIRSFDDWINESIPSQMKGSWSKCIVPEETVRLNKPKIVNKTVNPLLQKNGEHLSFPSANLNFLKNGRIVNKSGLILSYDNKLFIDFTKNTKNQSVREAFHSHIKKPLYKKGTYATICSDYSENYFHWMMEILPRMKMLEDEMEHIDYLIIPNDLKKFHKETLNHMGINSEKILEIKDGDHFLCEDLYVPSLPVRNAQIPTWVCDYLREKFSPTTIVEPFRLVYLSREDAFYRNIVNEDEIIIYLRNRGFEIIQMSNLSLEEEIKICSEAKIIVSPHGAALTSIVFTQRCKILELMPPFRIKPVYWKIASQVGAEYYYIVGEGTDAYPTKLRDFKIDMDCLKETINYMLDF